MQVCKNRIIAITGWIIHIMYIRLCNPGISATLRACNDLIPRHNPIIRRVISGGGHGHDRKGHQHRQAQGC